VAKKSPMASPNSPTGSPMDTDGLNSGILQENMLPDFFDDVVVARVKDQPWSTWTGEDKTILMDHYNYHVKCLEFIKKCWTSGLTKDKLPKPPNSDIAKLVKKGRKRKGPLPESEKSPKIKPKSYKEMTDNEFSDYLMGKRRETMENEVAAKITSTDLVSVAKDINGLHEKAFQSNLTSLCDHLDLGNGLIRAKEIFDAEKKNKNKKDKNKKDKNKTAKKTTETWVSWVEDNTPVKESYDRQLRVVARLVYRLPNLRNLALTYTELYNMREKIVQVSTRNSSFYDQWGGQ